MQFVLSAADSYTQSESAATAALWPTARQLSLPGQQCGRYSNWMTPDIQDISVISFTCSMTPAFRKLYLSGGFAPEQIMKFGKTHGLIINRFAK